MMEQPRFLTEGYAVSPQIGVEDVPLLAEAGFVLVICNRPDVEVPKSHQADALRTAVEDAGMRFEVLSLTHQTMTPENVIRQRDLAESAEGPVLAYCASGTRSSVVWALGQAGRMSADDILSRTAAVGYGLDGLRPMLSSSVRQT